MGAELLSTACSIVLMMMKARLLTNKILLRRTRNRPTVARLDCLAEGLILPLYVSMSPLVIQLHCACLLVLLRNSSMLFCVVQHRQRL